MSRGSNLDLFGALVKLLLPGGIIVLFFALFIHNWLMKAVESGITANQLGEFIISILIFAILIVFILAVGGIISGVVNDLLGE